MTNEAPTSYERSQIPLLHRIPLTRLRLVAARVLHWIVRLGVRSNQRQVRRAGISYELDLAEGIDLAVFVFGSFQGHVTKSKLHRLPSDGVVFDVGANMGSLTFAFAKQVPNGEVHAFEPAHSAFMRLRRNVDLNPGLAEQIRCTQAFVSNEAVPNSPLIAYSSWKVDASESLRHPVHGGSIGATDGVPSITLDGYCRVNAIDRVNLLKIDTDGHEWLVLDGARGLIDSFRPYVIFEVGLYLLHERGVRFEQYLDFFDSFGYSLLNSSNGKAITAGNFLTRIPLNSTIDVLAVPSHRA